MAVGRSFDQWQKDVFFSAAEEVQESADILESMYRMWVRERSDGSNLEISVELRGELHTALGTAKWQLEEFERAVNLSHGNLPSEDTTITRHRDFVIAIENQISRVEKALRDSLLEEGKQPLRWVQLDKEERDDLEIFLSSSPQTLQETKGKCPNHDGGFKGTVTINKNNKYIVEVEAKQPSKGKDEVIVQEDHMNGQRRTRSSPDIGAWKIVIADDEEDSERKTDEARQEVPNHASSLCGLRMSVGSAVKLKWFTNTFRKVKSGEQLQSRQGFSNYLKLKRMTRFAQGTCKEESKGCNIQQIAGRIDGVQRQSQVSQHTMQFGRSLRVSLLLVLAIFFIVPIVLYST